MKEQRLTRIADYISKHIEVTMKELQATFEVSMNTIRADVSHLEELGIVRKVYGGVVYNDRDYTQPILERFSTNTDIKRNMARAAAEIVEDGDIIYIDYGTTVMSMPEFLSGKKNVTVITPSFPVIKSAVNYGNLRLVALPGEFDHKAFGFVSENTIDDLRSYNCTKAFMACTGISDDGMVSSTSHYQKEIKSAAMSISRKRYLLAGHLKFNGMGLIHYGRLTDFDSVISDSLISDEGRALLERNNIDFKLV